MNEFISKNVGGGGLGEALLLQVKVPSILSEC